MATDLEDRKKYMLKYGCDLMTLEEKRIMSMSGKFRLQYQVTTGRGKDLVLSMTKDEDGKQNPKLVQAVAGDADALRSEIAERLLKDHPDFVKDCPFCGYVLRTPKAKQCRSCFKSWRDEVG